MSIIFILSTIVFALLYIINIFKHRKIKKKNEEYVEAMKEIDNHLVSVIGINDRIGGRLPVKVPEMAERIKDQFEDAQQLLEEMNWLASLSPLEPHPLSTMGNIAESARVVKSNISVKLKRLEEDRDHFRKLSEVKDKCGNKLRESERVAFSNDEILAKIHYFMDDGRVVIVTDHSEEKTVDPCKLRTIDLEEETDPREYEMKKTLGRG